VTLRTSAAGAAGDSIAETTTSAYQPVSARQPVRHKWVRARSGRQGRSMLASGLAALAPAATARGGNDEEIL
jgi:hypothetical protein